MKTKAPVRHPDGEQLLRYADGELRAAKAREIRLHLEACWECRTELEELQSLVGECVRYRKNVLQAYLPSPTAPWGDIYQGFARIDASRHDVPLFLRLFQKIRWTQWVPATAAVALICFLVLEYRQTPSVQAAELLRKAITAADSHPRKLRVIQIRTSKHRLTRRIGSELLVPAASASAVDAEALTSVQTLFRAANYSWEDPLSAKSYLAWHDGLSSKQDNVVSAAEASGQNFYRVQTTAGSGDLREATLKLRAADLQPVEERLEFRNSDWIEITEGGVEDLPAASAVADASTGAAVGTGITSNQEHTNNREAGIGDELRVLAALHRIGADLGDPIEVKRTGSQVLVTGVGIDPQRQREVHSALDASTNVVVRFSDPAAAAGLAAQDSTTAATANAQASQFRSRIEKQIGSHQDFEQLSAQILDMSETMMARAYAVRRLAERFPVALESQLAAGDRQLLGKMNREHAAVLTQQAAKIERVLSGVLIPMGGSAGNVSRSAIQCDSWQPCAEEVFRSARRVETLLAGMLGVTADDAVSAQLPSQVLSGLAQLRVNSEAYEHLTAQEPGDK